MPAFSKQRISNNLSCPLGTVPQSLFRSLEHAAVSLLLSSRKHVRTWALSGTSVWRPQSRYTVSRVERRIKNSRRIRDVAPKSRYTPPNQGVAPFSGPPVGLSSHPRQAGGQGGCRGGLVKGIAALFCSENGSRYMGGVAATITPVALLCACEDVGVLLVGTYSAAN